MKNFSLALAICTISLPAFAISPKGEVVKKKATETYVATKEYSIEQKEEFVSSMKQELKELDQNIAVMKAKTATKSDQVSTEVKSQLASLDQQRNELANKIDHLSTASKSAWSEMRSGIQSAYRELKTSYNRASDKFNEQK